MSIFTRLSRTLLSFTQNTNIQSNVIPIFTLLLIGLLIIPLSRDILDIFLVINLVVAVILLLRSLSLENSISLHSFPSMLLLATLFRLSLNVSSTRLILLYGDQGVDAAGEVIKSFGNFVVRGDFVVGVVVFIIIATVNFIVIAKGSARVAEVAARFTLDSLPGKQIAIDADLRAGNISKEEATFRRDNLNTESQFFGAMDGAMKFVQGDAIAGIIIVLINAIGGISLGLSKGIDFNEALNNYGILTIGDGLINILPSLLISISAGIIVTHVSSSNNKDTSNSILLQLFAEEKTIYIVAASLAVFGLIPGMPIIPFLLVSGFLFLLGKNNKKIFASNKDNFNNIQEGKSLTWEQASRSTNLIGYDARKEDNETLRKIRLSLDSEYLSNYLSNVKNQNSGPQFLSNLYYEKAELIYNQRGVRLPEIVVESNSSLDKGEFATYIRDQLVKRSSVEIDSLFVIATSGTFKVFNITPLSSSLHPYTFTKGSWIKKREQGLNPLRHLGVEILSIEEFLVYECISSALSSIDQLIGVDEVKTIVNKVRQEHQQLVEEIFDKSLISYGELTEILSRLVNENINIRDIKLILEAVSEFSTYNNIKDRLVFVNELHSFIRKCFSNNITQQLLHFSEKLRVFFLSSEVEEEFRDVLDDWNGRRHVPPIDPEFEEKLISVSKKIFNPYIEQGLSPVVILCAPDIRALVQEFYLRKLGNKFIQVVSFPELNDRVSTEMVAEITI
ncbi:MAG: FHIPEP family type III secretion protein [Proteobacteria bacterium]|nr:FHIPEP family type III secretion protein [Pseudomonadota bacterium]